MFPENLKFLRNKFGYEQIELAHKLGRKSGSSISEWEKGNYTPKIGVLAQIANIFNVDLDDLMNADLTLPSNAVPLTGKLKAVPVIGRIAAGEPILASEHIIEYREMAESEVPNDDSFFLIAEGDSMYPTIPDKSYVLIKPQPDIENGEIAAVLLNGDEDATLKRIKKQGDIMMLIPDNSKYDPIIVNKENPARIIGRATKISIDL